MVYLKEYHEAAFLIKSLHNTINRKGQIIMKNYEHYKRGYYMPPEKSTDWVNKEYIDKAPIWCSVDLRDGNQALIVPMNLEDKLEFFKTLVDIGFKEIEIGFPAASETEYEFCRTLIENDLIPDDVTIQVLTQARPHIIEKTFKAIDGAKHAIVHLYNSTSVAQREQVFKKDKEAIKKLNITWPQMSDLKYWNCEGAQLYAVSSIPHTVLIDGEGTILARGLHGDELQEKIAEAVK